MPVQGIASESVSGYVNAAVSSVDEGLVRQLLASEHCTTPKDEKEFVSESGSPPSPSRQAQLPFFLLGRMRMCPRAHSFTCWPLWADTRLQNGCSSEEPTSTQRTMLVGVWFIHPALCLVPPLLFTGWLHPPPRGCPQAPYGDHQGPAVPPRRRLHGEQHSPDGPRLWPGRRRREGNPSLQPILR